MPDPLSLDATGEPREGISPTTRALYLGVDLAGASNTWIAALAHDREGPCVALAPRLSTLEEIVRLAESAEVRAVAIDAQLSFSIQDEKGFRASDLALHALLPGDCRNWVASFNSLMAVPIRGHLLADALAPLVGTILETHPRASLRLALGAEASPHTRAYKRGGEAAEALEYLGARWSTRYRIRDTTLATTTDGALDAIVCATVAYLYHHQPGALQRLPSGDRDRRGRGPFYVTTSPHEVVRD